MKFKKKSRIVFVGDSITDCNRDYEAQLAGWGSFGDGYVNLINAFTTSLVPEKEYMIINKGISGNTVLDLKNRWQEDVLDVAPDVVTIMVGINEVWRYVDSVFSQVPLVSVEEFESVYRELIVTTKKTTNDIILMSPFMFEENHNNEMRKRLVDYQKVTKDLSAEFNLIFIDVQAPVDEFLTQQSSYALSSDRVHPSTISGHMLIAKAWLDNTGFKWNK